MKILVTGGAGYIGSVCVETLLDEGYEVSVFDNLSEGHLNAIDKRAKFINGDLNNFDAIDSALVKVAPDAVIHFSAYALVGESMVNPSKYFRNNNYAGLNLLDAMVKNNVKKIIFSSTCATFGIPEATPINEEFSQKPVNPYGESKLIFEKYLYWYLQIYGLECVIFRYFNAAGATRKFGELHRRETHLIPSILKSVLNSSEFKIFGTDYDTPDGTCIRDYVHVKDIADAHVLGLESTGSDHYNLGLGKGFSVQEVIEACQRVTGKKIKTIEHPRRAGDPDMLISSPEKAMNELKWQPKFNSIDQIIKTAWDWINNHPNGY